MRNRFSKQSGCHRGGKQNQRQRQPLPACQRVRLTRAVKDNFTRLLKGADSGPRSEQSARRQQCNHENDDRASVHKRRDYTTSCAETLKVLI